MEKQVSQYSNRTPNLDIEEHFLFMEGCASGLQVTEWIYLWQHGIRLTVFCGPLFVNCSGP